MTGDAKRALLGYLAVTLVFVLCGTNTGSTQSLGKFKGELVLKRLDGDGRTMELAAPFTYIDSRGIEWAVPAGTRVDGASIPRPLWSIIGAPFTGRYVEASVIHDYYCGTQARHWKAVHKVFLEGMLARGVDKLQAQLMYLAVYRFGPRWNFDVDACYCKGCPACANPIVKRVAKHKPTYKAQDFQELQKKLMTGRFTLEQLEDAADYQLNTEILRSR
jgi:hypothetical protein